jgi:hypothetical protein
MKVAAIFCSSEPSFGSNFDASSIIAFTSFEIDHTRHQSTVGSFISWNFIVLTHVPFT